MTMSNHPHAWILLSAVILIILQSATLSHADCSKFFSKQKKIDPRGSSIFGSIFRGGDSNTFSEVLISDVTSKSASDDNNINVNIASSERKKVKKRKSVISDYGDATKIGEQVDTPMKTASAPIEVASQTQTQTQTQTQNPIMEDMPTVFEQTHERQYDRYAACLAATEGLRRARDAFLTGNRFNKKQSAVKGEASNSWIQSLLPSKSNRQSNNQRGDEEYKRACAQYVLNSGKVIKALGLTVSQFNQMGRDVANDPTLKERVMAQAYLYRVASTINMNKIPVIEDELSEQLLKSSRRRRVHMFARSMTEIEELRTEQTERLKRALNIDKLPKGLNICDPHILPILSPKVRAVCEAYPFQAEQIVKKYGLNSNEFNQMLQQTRENPMFRWKVQKYMDTTGRKYNKNGADTSANHAKTIVKKKKRTNAHLSNTSPQS